MGLGWRGGHNAIAWSALLPGFGESIGAILVLEGFGKETHDASDQVRGAVELISLSMLQDGELYQKQELD